MADIHLGNELSVFDVGLEDRSLIEGASLGPQQGGKLGSDKRGCVITDGHIDSPAKPGILIAASAESIGSPLPTGEGR